MQDCKATDYDEPCSITDISCMDDCDANFVKHELRPACSFCDQMGFAPWKQYCADKGYCFAGMSTVSVLKEGSSDETVTKRIRDIKVGDSVLSRSPEGVGFSKVVALPHSEPEEAFVELDMGRTGMGLVRATLHHTFPTCSGKIKKAQDMRSGDCLRTATGKAHIHKVAQHPAVKFGETYTVVLEGDAHEINVGGVFSHTRAAHDLESASKPPMWGKM